jgi:DNA-binding transcriptional LysR family regulator
MLSEIHDGAPPSTQSLEIDPGIVDSKRLQMFYVAAKEGGFAAAAGLLGVSPSAISHAIKGLEEDLGCSLFRRSGPHVSPTGAGVKLLPMVEDLLQKMSLMRSELAILDGRSESLSFALPAALHGILQSEVLSLFRECFPLARLEISVRQENAGLGVGDFEIDYLASAEVNNDRVRRNLFEESLSWYAAPFHEFGQRGKISPADLRQMLLIYPDRDAYQLSIRRLGRSHDSDSKKWILPNPQCARDLARQGQGLALLPKWVAQEAVDDGSLNLLKMPGVELRRTCCAIWPASRPLTWAADVFLSLVTMEFEKAEDFPASQAV